MKICFASNNQHKLEEIKQVLAGGTLEIVSLPEINCFEELPETSPTLEGNALQKATYVFEKYQVICFADDTGLEVTALDGAPGVFSARYAGDHKSSEDNINLLLENLKNKENREGQFRTVIALVGLTDQPAYFEGMVRGSILTGRQGTSGFGYDPVFVPHAYEQSFAEITLEEKNKISHRARAIKKLVGFLNSYSPQT